MTKRRVICGALIVLAMLACLAMYRHSFDMPLITKHQGDGVFTDLSHWAGPLPYPGYSIKMPEFNLDKPFRAQYRVAALSEIRRDCTVYLGISDANDNLSKASYRSLQGEFGAQVLDSKGQTLVNVSGSLGGYSWTFFYDFDALCQPGKSSFTPNGAEEYKIRFSYYPDARLASYRGFVYLRCEPGP